MNEGGSTFSWESAMKPIKIETDKFQFVTESGEYRLDTLPVICYEEEGMSGFIRCQEDRVALGKFLMEVGSKLATPNHAFAIGRKNQYP